MATPGHSSELRSWWRRNMLGQFGLGQLMVAVTVICVLLGLGVVIGGSVWGLVGWMFSAVASLCQLVVVACLTIGVVYGRGVVRPFCIGALIPTGLLAIRLSLTAGSFDLLTLLAVVVANYIAALISGYCCVRLYRFLTDDQKLSG